MHVWRQAALLGMIVLSLVAAATASASRAPGGHVARHQSGEDWRCVEINGQTTLNLRGGPGLHFPVLASLPPGEQLQGDYAHVSSADWYDWVPVRYTGGNGWAISERLSPCLVDTAAGGGPPAGGEPVLEGVNQDGVLDRFEIAAIARSVVLVANIQNGWIDGTGTGTIITPDGLVLTNAHVVEGADDVAIALLDDINDPPKYQYYGEVIGYDMAIDVALVAIRADSEGRPVAAADLDLPYIPATLSAHDVFRGDTVTIFGYPGIGDDYLVVTTGTIVSVENGDIEGERMPVWYRTDAEIAPGNSGGLVVNQNGEFVGVPTFVRSEAETGGRLGGIRPAEVVLAVVLDDADLAAASNAPAPGTTGAPVAPAVDDVIHVRARDITVEHGVGEGGEPGMRFHVSLALEQWPGADAWLAVRFYYDDLTAAPLVNPAAPEAFREAGDTLRAQVRLLPCCEPGTYDDLTIFVPYGVLGFTEPGMYPLKVRLELTTTDRAWHRTLGWEYIRLILR